MHDSDDLSIVDAGNPLLNRLPGERGFFEWAEHLQYDPRRDWVTPYGKRPESHAQVIKHLLVPTERNITLCLNLQSMLIQSLRQRDPRLALNRRRLAAIANLDAKKLGDSLEKMPWFPDGASGAILQGPTGVAKTHSMRAFCRGLNQVLDHGENEECGWKALKQLVYLEVPMPDEPSRRTLYKTILEQVDYVLGTSYASEVKERTTNGDLLLKVIKVLTLHRCGMLILEEAQVRVLGPQTLGKEFLVTFLRLLNCGIPLVLIGNPVSFTNVLSFSQDLRRFSCAGVYDFAPAYDACDPEWTKDLVPGIWGWTLFDVADERLPPGCDLNELLYERTGGVPDFLTRYRRESLVMAIRRCGSSVSRKDMEDAWNGPAMKPLHKLIDALVRNDSHDLAQFEDWPLAYMQAWSAEKTRRAALQAVQKREDTAAQTANEAN